jgi:aminopeptidase
VEGIVYSTKPLSYNGELIEDFNIRFEKGKAVEAHAKKGEELLKKMISMDEGAAYLGEVALVPYDSPISNSNILFYNTLYDENASCHLALGKAYTCNIKGYENMTMQDFKKMGINDSLNHVDFMIGAKDTNIIGVCKDGKKIQVFKDGNWAI